MKDSNPRKMDSNPSYRMKLKTEDHAKEFDSLSYGFESSLGAQFKFCKGDSNPRVTNSNPPFCKCIKYLIRTAAHFKFQNNSPLQRVINAPNGQGIYTLKKIKRHLSKYFKS